MALHPAPEQDLGVAEPVGPAPNWPARMKPQSVIPSRARLDAEHQLAMMHNSDQRQTHIILDRFHQGHELAPGQREELDMLVADIKYFQRMRRPNRMSNDGRLLQPHPIVVENCRAAPEDVSPANLDAEVEAALERQKKR
jgi:hypothetical protein